VERASSAARRSNKASCAALSALSDRLKFLRKAQGAEIILSMQHVLNCGTAGTCNGGSQTDVYAWISSITDSTGSGVAYESVNPYIACSAGNPHEDGTTDQGFCKSQAVLQGTTCEPINIARSCATFGVECTPLASYPNATVSAYGVVSGESAIMSEVYANGPVACSMDAEPIIAYHGGVLTEAATGAVNHFTSIVGWGEEDGVGYWIVRNSWGESWGEGGFFRVARGKNLLSIEEECAWATIGSYTGTNVPCDEDGANCLPTGYTAGDTHPYGERLAASGRVAADAAYSYGASGGARGALLPS